MLLYILPTINLHFTSFLKAIDRHFSSLFPRGLNFFPGELDFSAINRFLGGLPEARKPGFFPVLLYRMSSFSCAPSCAINNYCIRAMLDHGELSNLVKMLDDRKVCHHLHFMFGNISIMAVLPYSARHICFALHTPY